jgi:hypothetical protein
MFMKSLFFASTLVVSIAFAAPADSELPPAGNSTAPVNTGSLSTLASADYD